MSGDMSGAQRGTPRRWSGRTALTAVLALGALMSASSPAAGTVERAAGNGDLIAPLGQPRPEVIDPQLRSELATSSVGEQLEYLVTLDAAPDLTDIRFDRTAVVAALQQTAHDSQAPVVNHLRAQGAEVVNTFWLANTMLVRSAPEVLTELTGLPMVSQVHAVSEHSVPEPEVSKPSDVPGTATVEDRTWGLDQIGAHRVWDELGLDGAGARVAVLDTGVQPLHPDISDNLATDDPDDPSFPGGWMQWAPDGTPIAGEPQDGHNHGTHVSGTVVGGNDSGTHIGVAPGAELMHGLVLPGGSGTTPQIIAGMQWAVEPYDQDGNPAGQPAQVVNMSFGPQTGGINDELMEPIRNMYAAGVLPVASAGNCGDDCHASPANVFEALAVGATDVQDDVAPFSSGGLVTADDWQDPPADWPDSWVVPQVSAPGVEVYSSVATAFGAPYGYMNGTSMAAPHVAGVAALMLAGDPSLGIDAIADVLIDTSFFDERYGEQRPNSRFGHGRVDAFQAVSRVVLESGVAGEIVDPATGEAVEGVTVQVPQAGVSMRTGADGVYQFRLHPGTYTLELSWAGEPIASVSDVVVTEDETTAVDVALGGVAGQITDAESGFPVADATVEVAETGVSVVTDDQGSYRIYLAPDDYTLELGAFGYEPARASDVPVTASEITPRDVAMTALPTGSVTGEVTFVDSQLGVPEVTVELVDGPLSAVTAADGSYTIAEVPAGEHAVVARPDLFVEPDPVKVTVAGDETASLDFRLDCDAQCAGQWVSTYDGPVEGGRDAAAAVAISPDGSRIYVTGGSSGPGTHLDYATVAYDTVTGQELWVTRYDGPTNNEDSAGSIAVSPDGQRVFVTGTSLAGGSSSSAADYATVAYDAETGRELWVTRYDGPSNDFDTPNAIGVSPDSQQVFVTGQSRTETDGSAHTEYATLAYDAASGDELWFARYNGPSNNFDAAHDLAVSPDGQQVFVTGGSPGEGGQGAGTGWDYATVAYDASDGQELWVARYDGPASGLDRAAAVTVSPDGSLVVVTGRSNGIGTSADYATVAYDPDTGDEVWVARYDGPASSIDVANDVTVSPDSSTVYVTGESRSGSGAHELDYATVAYDAIDGRELWVARYDGPGTDTDRPRQVAVSPDGSQVAVTGASTGQGTGFDYATVVYGADDGQEQWVGRYDGPASDDDHATGVVWHPDGSQLFVTGRSALGIGDDPLIAPGVYRTIAYDADGTAESPVFVPHDVRVEPRVVTPGVEARVSAQVSNVGTAAGSYAAGLVVDGELAGTTVVTLEPGAATEVAWPVVREQPGVYSLQVGSATGTLQVTSCDTTLDANHAGPLRVAAGTTCLAEGARVTGPVTVDDGAGLVANGATITGPVTTSGAAMVSVHDSRLTGPVTIAGSTEGVQLSDNQVTGLVTVTDNHTGQAPIVVSGNTIVGVLACTGNTPALTDAGTPNTVTGRTTGQCAGTSR